MKRITQEELNVILENHQHWLRMDCEGWSDMRADLSHTDLGYMNLSHACLESSDLSYANLYGADLHCANFSYANLYGADLHCANFRGADFYCTDLGFANLRYANLAFANLNRANLSYALLDNANLSYALLDNAFLDCAHLELARNFPFIPYTCPDTGVFIGYKKAQGYIVQLEVLNDARRCSSTSRKCRCDKAKVLSIQNLDGTKADRIEVCSDYDFNFIYRVGEIVEEPNFDENRWNECSKGIHFFINRQEAVDY